MSIPGFSMRPDIPRGPDGSLPYGYPPNPANGLPGAYKPPSQPFDYLPSLLSSVASGAAAFAASAAQMQQPSPFPSKYHTGAKPYPDASSYLMGPHFSYPNSTLLSSAMNPIAMTSSPAALLSSASQPLSASQVAEKKAVSADDVQAASVLQDIAQGKKTDASASAAPSSSSPEASSSAGAVGASSASASASAVKSSLGLEEPDGGVYECPECKKPHFTQASHARHVRTHTRAKRFVCTDCNKKFKDKNSLTEHIRIHTGEKPYKCDGCTKSFARKSNLTRHYRIHNDDKRFLCRLCSKRFTEKHHLTAHIRTHTGEKPFLCPTCFRDFTDRSNMLRHVRTHGEEATEAAKAMIIQRNKEEEEFARQFILEAGDAEFPDAKGEETDSDDEFGEDGTKKEKKPKTKEQLAAALAAKRAKDAPTTKKASIEDLKANLKSVTPRPRGRPKKNSHSVATAALLAAASREKVRDVARRVKDGTGLSGAEMMPPMAAPMMLVPPPPVPFPMYDPHIVRKPQPLPPGITPADLAEKKRKHEALKSAGPSDSAASASSALSPSSPVSSSAAAASSSAADGDSSALPTINTAAGGDSAAPSLPTPTGRRVRQPNKKYLDSIEIPIKKRNNKRAKAAPAPKRAKGKDAKPVPKRGRKAVAEEEPEDAEDMEEDEEFDDLGDGGEDMGNRLGDLADSALADQQ